MKFRFPVIIIDEDFRSENSSGLGIRVLAKAIEDEGSEVLGVTSYGDLTSFALLHMSGGNPALLTREPVETLQTPATAGFYSGYKLRAKLLAQRALCQNFSPNTSLPYLQSTTEIQKASNFFARVIPENSRPILFGLSRFC